MRKELRAQRGIPREIDMKKSCMLMVSLLVPILIVVSEVSSGPALKPESATGFLGFIDPGSGIKPTLGLGGEVCLGKMLGPIEVSAFGNFWVKNYTKGAADWSWFDLGIGGVGRYYIPVSLETGYRIRPYAGAGLGLYIERWSWKISFPGFKQSDSDTDLDIGLKFLGGVRATVSGIELIGEASYTVANPNYLGFWVGVSFELPK